MTINDQKLTAAEILALALPKKRARAKSDLAHGTAGGEKPTQTP